MKQMDKAKAADAASASAITRPTLIETMAICGQFHVEHIRDGKVIFEEDFKNLITTVGKNDMLEKYLEGSAWSTGTVYMGLKGTGSPAAGDTMSSHAGWSELNISASSGARQSVSFDAASSGSKATDSVVAFSITAAGPTDVYGCFIVIGGSATNGNTSGTLFSAGNFAAPREVYASDVLNVSYSASLT